MPKQVSVLVDNGVRSHERDSLLPLLIVDTETFTAVPLPVSWHLINHHMSGSDRAGRLCRIHLLSLNRDHKGFSPILALFHSAQIDHCIRDGFIVVPSAVVCEDLTLFVMLVRFLRLLDHNFVIIDTNDTV